MAAAHPKVSIFCSGLLLLLSFWISPIADAAKIFVPQDIASIQEAIDTSVEGDEIIVSPGDWIGPFDFLGKNITVRSSAGPEQTRLIGTAANSVVRFVSGEATQALLEGFSIRSGSGSVTSTGICGGGVLILNSTPTIRNCIIEENSASSGAGVHIEGPTFGIVVFEDVIIRNNNAADAGGGVTMVSSAEVTMTNCVIENNFALVVSGGIQCEESTLTASTCTLSGNSSSLAVGGAWIFLDSEAQFLNCVIENNESPISGGGIVISDLGRATLDGCVIRDNFGGSSGGGVLLDSGSRQEDQVIRGCVFHNNYSADGGAHLAVSFNPVSLVVEKCTFGLTAVNSGSAISVNNGNLEAVSIDSSVILPGAGLSIEAIPGSTLVQYSCVEDLLATSVMAIDTIDMDPLFTDAANGIYTLEPGSPCIDNGNPLLPFDVDGTITDMGALGPALVPVRGFRRGDVDQSGIANIADAIQLLSFLFGPGSGVATCADAMDCNDDGSLNLADAISLLDTLFVSGDPLPTPHLECGQDPTADSLTCDSYCS